VRDETWLPNMPLDYSQASLLNFYFYIFGDYL
jgi:hypothetical protein